MNDLYRISSLSISKVYIVKYVIFLASIFYCVIELASIWYIAKLAYKGFLAGFSQKKEKKKLFLQDFFSSPSIIQ